MRPLLGCLIGLIGLCWPVYAQDVVTLFEAQYRLKGYAIAKSTSARIVNVFRDDALRDPKSDVKGVYVPAGTLVAILDYSYKDASGNTWQLASTEDGILMFIRERNKVGTAGGKQYYDQSFLKEKLAGTSYSIVAVAQAGFEVKTEKYGNIIVTTSEAYAVVDPDATDGTAWILLDKSKMGDKWISNEIVVAPKDRVALIAGDAFEKASDWIQPFTEYDAASEAKGILQKLVKDKNLDSEETQRKISDFISQRFLTTKSCESEISYDLTLAGELGIDLSSVLSPVTAKLALTGKLSGKVSHAKGEDFSIRRVQRKDVVYEIKTERTRENCSSAPKSIRTTVSGNNDVSGEITAGDLAAAGFPPDTNGFPIYRCRKEFRLLRAILANKYSLPQSIATFVIGTFGEFEGAADAVDCKPITQ
jgi:hypothetical protein